MSKTLSSVAKKEFDDEVKQAYQGAGKLRNTVTLRTGVVGDTYNFRKMGKGLANQKPPQADVTPMNVSHELIPATLTNWNAPEYTDIFDAAEVNFDEQAELAFVIAAAMGRREDQLILDALDAATLATTQVDTNVGGAGTNLNVPKLRAASTELSVLGVDDMDRTFVCNPRGMDGLLGETEATSADYNTVKALVQGDINTFVGFDFKKIEDRAEGGLPLAGAVRQNWAYHKAAIGLAVGIEITSDVNWIPTKTSWLANGIFKAGAVVRDTDGAVDIQTTE